LRRREKEMGNRDPIAIGWEIGNRELGIG